MVAGTIFIYIMNTICLQAESEVCSICTDEFTNKEDLLHHISVMHPGQEVPSTSTINVSCETQENNNTSAKS